MEPNKTHIIMNNRKKCCKYLALGLIMGLLTLSACAGTDELSSSTETQVRESDTMSKNQAATEENRITDDQSIEDQITKDQITKDQITEDQLATGEDGMETEQHMLRQFYQEPLSDDVKQRITGISYPKEEQTNISYEDLAYVHVLHYNFDKEVREGELICNQAIAEDLVEIFTSLYEAEYPIEKIQLIDVYDGDDEASMEDNNTSCFNYRTIAGSERLSNHSYGCAIDINPLYNPYVSVKSDGTTVISPLTAGGYTDRSASFLYKITTEDLCYQLFVEHGFVWGGDWSNPKDYQHFEKKLN